jgi:hypothetical protein
MPFGSLEDLLLYSQQPTTSQYPEPDEPTPQSNALYFLNTV